MDVVQGDSGLLWLLLELAEVARVVSRSRARWSSVGSGRRRRHGASNPVAASSDDGLR